VLAGQSTATESPLPGAVLSNMADFRTVEVARFPWLMICDESIIDADTSFGSGGTKRLRDLMIHS
jgi:hypothetical protein